MSIPRPRQLVALVLGAVLVVALALSSSGPATSATTPKAGGPSLTAAVSNLKARATALPAKSRAQRKAKARLVVQIGAVGKQVRAGKLCQAKSGLLIIRKTLKSGGLAGVTAGRRAAVSASALRLQGLILSRPAAKSCGGAQTAPAASGKPESTVISSSPTELEVRVALPPAQLVGKSAGGKAYDQLVMPGLSTDSAPGAPGVPTLGESFAIPEGATIKLDTAKSDSYTLEGVDLYPSQQQPVDAAADPFADKPFKIDPKAYQSADPYPVNPATAGEIGELRDLKVGQLALAGAQYTPKSKKLKVFTSVAVKVTFPGSTGEFGGEGAGSAWNDPYKNVYSSLLVNGRAVTEHLRDIGSLLRPCGEQMLIVTSPALRSAADTLAAARNAKGILTRVVETGAGAGKAGTTADEIRTFVQAEVANTKCIRPSYLILFGNTANVPTFPGDTTNPSIPSDFDYALKFRTLYLPNLAPGRIPAATLAQANTMVSKIVNYEDAPPSDPNYYANATLTSYFQDEDPEGPTGPDGQDERGFVRTTEQLRTVLQNHGKTVSRVYTTGIGRNPKKFDDGTDLPAELKMPGFAWNGTGNDVKAQVNTGRFLVLHRDHGSQFSVAHPSMDGTTVNGLTNGALLPVFFSVNCASGGYDNPGNPSFDEQWLLKSGGGAVGVVGDSRDSPTEVNNRMALGMFDAIYPDTLPFAGSSTSVTSMGDVVNLGKLHTILDTVSIRDFYVSKWNADPAGANADIRAEQRLYGYFGDPSMQIRTKAPLRKIATGVAFAGAKIRAVFGADAAGAVATLLEDGVPIGKAFVAGDGSVDIDPTSAPGNGKLAVVLGQDGVDSEPVTLREAVAPTPAPSVSPTPAATPAPKPNLVIDSVSVQRNPDVVIAVAYNWVVTVRNAGTAPTAGAFNVATVQDLPAGNGPFNETKSVTAPLAPGATATLRFSPQYIGSGASMTATADSGGAVDESNEADNAKTTTVP